MVYMYHGFLVHSSADGHIGCFHVLAMTNSAAMNIGVHVSLSDLLERVWRKGMEPIITILLQAQIYHRFTHFPTYLTLSYWEVYEKSLKENGGG